MFDVSAGVFLGPCGTKGPVYLATVRKQAERRARGFSRGFVHFPTLADRKQAMTAIHQEAPGRLLWEPLNSEEGRGYTALPPSTSQLSKSDLLKSFPHDAQFCQDQIF